MAITGNRNWCNRRGEHPFQPLPSLHASSTLSALALNENRHSTEQRIRKARIRLAFVPASPPPTRESDRTSTRLPLSAGFIRTTTSSLKPYQNVVSVASIRPDVCVRPDRDPIPSRAPSRAPARTPARAGPSASQAEDPGYASRCCAATVSPPYIGGVRRIRAKWQHGDVLGGLCVSVVMSWIGGAGRTQSEARGNGNEPGTDKNTGRRQNDTAPRLSRAGKGHGQTDERYSRSGDPAIHAPPQEGQKGDSQRNETQPVAHGRARGDQRRGRREARAEQHRPRDARASSPSAPFPSCHLSQRSSCSTRIRTAAGAVANQARVPRPTPSGLPVPAIPSASLMLNRHRTREESFRQGFQALLRLRACAAAPVTSPRGCVRRIPDAIG